MGSSALILAAHGSRHGPVANAEVRDHADTIARTDLFDEVAVAFHQGSPTFANVLDTIAADAVTVVPVMTSDGYYARTDLPRALAFHPRFSRFRVSIGAAVGSHPRCAVLVRERAIELATMYGLSPDETTVIVIGHGTARHSRSRASTLNVAAVLRQASLFADVRAAFLDDTPAIESVCAATRQRNLIVVPFLIGSGHHATCDVPRRLGFDSSNGASLPLFGRVADRLVVCDAAIGTRPEMSGIILECAREAAVVRYESGHLVTVR